MFYQDQTDLLKSSQRYVQEGMEANEPVLVAQPPAQLNRLREMLPRARDVTYVDMTIAGRNPGRILPWVLHDFILKHPGRRVRFVSEPVWPSRVKAAHPACVQYEGLVNLALAGRDVQVLCAYDVIRLPPHAIDDSHVTHPFVQYGTGPVRPNDEYTPAALAAALDQPLEPPPPGAPWTTFGWNDLRLLRDQVEVRAVAAGLTPNQVAAAKLAVTEAASNAVRHGGGHGTLRIWQEAEYLVFDVHSALPLSDPLAGRLQPSPDSVTGRGLILINHVCDLVRMHGSRPLGTTIRMWLAGADFRPRPIRSRRS
jgi:anti-sigma regulatory factor (Ser/Thr protein kinase)